MLLPVYGHRNQNYRAWLFVADASDTSLIAYCGTKRGLVGPWEDKPSVVTMYGPSFGTSDWPPNWIRIGYINLITGALVVEVEVEPR